MEEAEQAQDDAPMSETEKVYNDIRKRISKRYESRAELTTHVFFFSFAAIGLVFLLSSGSGPLFVRQMCSGVMALWLFGVVGHTINFAFEEMRENAIERELQRMGLLTPVQREKAKNPPERLVMLGEDGELRDYPPFDEDDSRKAQTR